MLCYVSRKNAFYIFIIWLWREIDFVSEKLINEECRTFTSTDHSLGHKTHLNTFKHKLNNVCSRATAELKLEIRNKKPENSQVYGNSVANFQITHGSKKKCQGKF